VKRLSHPVAEISSLRRNGQSICLNMPKPLMLSLGWTLGDRLAMRQQGNQLIIERIPMERIALLVHGRVEGHTARE